MKKIFFLSLLLLTVFATGSARSRIRVACVGNSVTYGYLLPDREQNCYPARLQALLGDGYEVRNFGHSGATLLRRGHNPYDRLPEFQEALRYNADLVVIHLGLNDTDPRNWPHHGDDFIADYRALIDSFRTVNPAVRIWICRMTPIFHTHPRFRSGTRDWHYAIQQRIGQIARTAGTELIDLYEPLHSRPDLFPDALHPNSEGADVLARTVYAHLTGNFGGLALPPAYSDGMVMQRNRPFALSGRANAGERVTVEFLSRKLTTQAGPDGRWSVSFPATPAGGPYELRVTAPSRQLHFRNVWMGEVWICSGPSNMEFPLCSAVTSAEDLQRADTLSRLHLFDMRSLCATDAVEWSPAQLDSVNRLLYKRPASWTVCNAEKAARFSAIAFSFGATLADSLGCHVGLIANPVGGSTTESWIDRTTLENEFPEILYNWQKSDYGQPWARGRADLNVKKSTNPLQRHPYEPCYLFESAVRPIEGYPAAGVLWYQGESNAHNIELHERLFPLLVSSWRTAWNDAALPFYTVQLSSIGTRPSWPAFRDSQRRLAERMEGVEMVVSSDLGDSLDVHPRHKREVGLRLALSALCHRYGHKATVPSGPAYRTAERHGKTLLVRFDYGKGLRPADGKTVRSFEVAGPDGLYHEAEAKIGKDGIILKSRHVKEPCAVRYGWQAFTRANLVNSAGLPASTFREENVPATP